MLGRDSKEELKAYSPWSWLAGYALVGVVAWIMFGLATGFL